MFKLTSKILIAEIDVNGAELTSLRNIETGKEYIWQADSNIWNRHAPVLFPCVGRMLGDSYIYNDARYYLQKHGFARNMPFEVISSSETSVMLRLSSDATTKSVFPFDFELDVYYSLVDDTLNVKYVVRNVGSNTMYFSIGFHPGFNCKIGDILSFSSKETMNVPYLNGSDVSEDPNNRLVFDSTKTLTLTSDLFEKGSLALEKPQSKSISLCDENGVPYITETFGKVNMVWLWSKPGADFVCVEPWSGSDERSECEILKDKKDILSLDFGCEYTLNVDLKIHK